MSAPPRATRLQRLSAPRWKLAIMSAPHPTQRSRHATGIGIATALGLLLALAAPVHGLLYFRSKNLADEAFSGEDRS